MRGVIAVLFLLVGSLAQAFPEMVRHGYVNCTTCHLSPNGAGVLTAYGRGLSEEVLSTWKVEHESKFAYGIVNPPEWLSLGGDFRLLQSWREDSRVRTGRLIPMQADAEAGVTYKQWQAVGTFGYERGVLSRRHYVLFRANDQLHLRAGKFMRAFGINMADHYTSIKRDLPGMDISILGGAETYNVEASWLGDNFDVFATAVLGRPDKEDLNREKGVALRSSVALGETSKLGVSYFHGGNDRQSRHAFGPYAILGFTPRLFALAELDFQTSYLKTNRTNAFGFVSYLRLDYELFRGFHWFGTHELTRIDLKDDSGKVDVYGIGLQWFPRPHFDFQLVYQKQKLLGPGENVDFGWFMSHFYL